MRTAVIALLAAMAMCWSAGVQAGEKYALCIGVNDCPEFRLPDGGRPRPLRGAETDAEAFSQLLVEQFGFDKSRVSLLLGRQANLDGVRRAMKKVSDAAGSSDAVVFYFAGHGADSRCAAAR